MFAPRVGLCVPGVRLNMDGTSRASECKEISFIKWNDHIVAFVFDFTSMIDIVVNLCDDIAKRK